ncbi:hypothetical protein RJ640_024142 [Escallonia rubra]|uniref:Uncharacterized protein n=1 Tax=Escallonia rubra TaxID=112253 RepID=A0AA88QMP0_9ASTE|nr:hypothetical protein RJ640_024142 [Escallonia rubra]
MGVEVAVDRSGVVPQVVVGGNDGGPSLRCAADEKKSDNEFAEVEMVVSRKELPHKGSGSNHGMFFNKYSVQQCCTRAEKCLILNDLGGQIPLSQENTVEENDEVIQKFHTTVRAYFRGPLKPPFNEAARKAAGFGPQCLVFLFKL